MKALIGAVLAIGAISGIVQHFTHRGSAYTVYQAASPPSGAVAPSFPRMGVSGRFGPPGMIVDGVFPGSPAALAGLAPGDLLLSANNVPLTSLAALAQAWQGQNQLNVVVRRGANPSGPLALFTFHRPSVNPQGSSMPQGHTPQAYQAPSAPPFPTHEQLWQAPGNSPGMQAVDRQIQAWKDHVAKNPPAGFGNPYSR